MSDRSYRRRRIQYGARWLDSAGRIAVEPAADRIAAVAVAVEVRMRQTAAGEICTAHPVSRPLTRCGRPAGDWAAIVWSPPVIGHLAQVSR